MSVIQIIIAVMAIAVTILTAVCGYLASRVNKNTTSISTLTQHVAENYVRGNDLSRVERALNELRTEMTHKVDEIVKALHQLIGSKK